MSRISRALSAIAVWLVVSVSGASAQATAGDIIKLVQEGKFDEARATLAASPHNDLDALFLEAQIFVRQGQPQEAVKIYRAVLAVQPGQIEIRQILAQTLLQMGDLDAARFHYRELLENDRRDGFVQQYANILRQIDQNTPSGVSASFAIVPSTNINRGTENTLVEEDNPNFVINQSSRETSGLGIQLGVNGFLRFPREKGGLYTLSASAFQVLYNRSEYNVFQPTVSVRFQNGSEAGIWSWEVFARRTFRQDIAGSNSTANTFGLSFSGRRALAQPNILTYSTVIQQTAYDTVTNQSGPSATFKLGLQRNISTTMSVNGGIVLGRGLPKGDSFKYRSAGVELGVSNTWKGGWATYLGTDYGVRWYDANFALTTNKRNDRYLTLTGSVLNSTFSWNGFSPRLTCSYQTGASNINFYDYDAYECNVLFTRGF